MEHVSKYAQGTVWQWSQSEVVRYEEGVQAGTRPVLIISNNTFNTHSSSVNCVTITSVLKESPVHVPLQLSMLSHIQCEQVHTVPKKDLHNFKGIVSPATMEEVKAKLKFQLNMVDDKNSDLLKDIDNKLRQLNDEVKMGFVNSEKEMYTISILKELLLQVNHMKKDFVGLFQATSLRNQSHVAEVASIEEAKPVLKAVKKKKSKLSGKRYSAEERAFILDESNSLDTLIDRFGFRDKHAAYKTRYYFKKSSP